MESKPKDDSCPESGPLRPNPRMTAVPSQGLCARTQGRQLSRARAISSGQHSPADSSQATGSSRGKVHLAMHKASVSGQLALEHICVWLDFPRLPFDTCLDSSGASRGKLNTRRRQGDDITTAGAPTCVNTSAPHLLSAAVASHSLSAAVCVWLLLSAAVLVTVVPFFLIRHLDPHTMTSVCRPWTLRHQITPGRCRGRDLCPPLR